MSTLYVDNLEPNLGSRVLAAGHVVQVVCATYGTKFNVTATGWIDSGLEATITPTSTSSKILVSCTAAGLYKEPNYDTGGALRIVNSSDGDTFLLNSLWGWTGTTDKHHTGNISGEYLFSPATTSAITYKLQIVKLNSSGTLQFNTGWSSDYYPVSSMTLMEIAQ